MKHPTNSSPQTSFKCHLMSGESSVPSLWDGRDSLLSGKLSMGMICRETTLKEYGKHGTDFGEMKEAVMRRTE